MKPKSLGNFLFLLVIFCLFPTEGACLGGNDSFVRVSEEYPRYFCLSDGSPYIAVGCNIAAISDRSHLEHYMKMISENGGNFARVWLNSSFLEIEKEYGVWDEEAVSNIDRLLELASLYDIKVKMCIESFRHIRYGRNRWDTKASYHTSNGGPFVDMEDFINSEKGKAEYLRRLSFLMDRYGSAPEIFGWELWNEMNAVNAPDIREWNIEMLDTVHRMFPDNLVMQSLGSLDRESSFGIYEFIFGLASNDVLQVHRYLDEGAELPICQAPIDSLCENAVQHMLAIDADKPVLMAECGAVMPSHSGPHILYGKDTEGILFHDFLFAPFFCGAAGCGHIWHWDHYLDKTGVWFQMGRFSEAVEGLDPVRERFVPARLDSGRLKVYTLVGKDHIIAWCRDRECTWRSELLEGIPAETMTEVVVDMGELVAGREVSKVEVYDPWNDEWTELPLSSKVVMNSFKRSSVIKITL